MMDRSEGDYSPEIQRQAQAGPESAGIEVLVRKLLGEDRKKVVFDLSGVNYIGSTGLGVLTLCSATMQAAGGALRVAAAQPLTQKLFELTKFDKILSFFLP